MSKCKSLFFSEAEFFNCTPSCSSDDIDNLTLCRLDNLRSSAGIPLRLNSAFRSVDYELSHGRSGASAHCLGRAFDIRCTTSDERYKIVRAALQVGFHRIGIYPTFIHVDDCGVSDGFTPGVIWYGRGTSLSNEKK